MSDSASEDDASDATVMERTITLAQTTQPVKSKISAKPKQKVQSPSKAPNSSEVPSSSIQVQASKQPRGAKSKIRQDKPVPKRNVDGNSRSPDAPLLLGLALHNISNSEEDARLEFPNRVHQHDLHQNDGSPELKTGPLSVKSSVVHHSNPSMIEMMKRGIQCIDDNRGASIAAIKKWILGAYPDVNQSHVKSYMKKAIERGIESGVFIRPKGTQQSKNLWLTGRLKLGEPSTKINLIPKPKNKSKAGATKKKSSVKTDAQKEIQPESSSNKGGTNSKPPNNKVSQTADHPSAKQEKENKKVLAKSENSANKPHKKREKTTAATKSSVVNDTKSKAKMGNKRQ